MQERKQLKMENDILKASSADIWTKIRVIKDVISSITSYGHT